jgi:hypothetical protein
MLTLPYSIAKPLIKDGDILLFEGTTLPAWALKSVAESKYSHVGIASWAGNTLECVEMKEFKGGRAVNLRNYVRQKNGLITVYRAISPAKVVTYDFVDGELIYNETLVEYDGFAVSQCMREHTAEHYGWKSILWMSLRHLPGMRLFVLRDENSLDDEIIKSRDFVCSTVVSHCVRKIWVDLIKNRADHRMEPGDIVRSPLLAPMFTLVTDSP